MRGCIHPSTGSPDSQAPVEAFSEELGVGRKNTGAPRALIMEAEEVVCTLSILLACCTVFSACLYCNLMKWNSRLKQRLSVSNKWNTSDSKWYDQDTP